MSLELLSRCASQKEASLSLRKYLLAKGDPNAIVTCDFSGDELPQTFVRMISQPMTLLQRCCVLEDVSLVNLLLDKMSTDVRASSSFLPTPLHLACFPKPQRANEKASFGSTNIAELLVLKGADPDGDPSRFSVTPLHLALLSGNAPLTQTLIQHGATPSLGCRLSLRLAAMSRSVDCLRLVRSGDPAAVNWLIPLPLTDDGRTILHFACSGPCEAPQAIPDGSMDSWERQLAFVDAVLALKVSVNARDCQGNTALHYAWASGNAHVAYYLVRVAKADTSLVNNDQHTPFRCHPTRRSAASLVLSGLVDAKDSTGPLSPTNFLEFLIRTGVADSAKPNPEDGNTALHYFCHSPIIGTGGDMHSLFLLQSLIDEGCDPNALNMLFESPLLLACESGKSPEFVKILLAAGGMPTLVCRGKVTPLQILLQIAPHPQIGRVALALVTDGAVDLNDCSIATNSLEPFAFATIIEAHPHWRPFYRWMHPVLSEQEAHADDYKCFMQFYSGKVPNITTIEEANVPPVATAKVSEAKEIPKKTAPTDHGIQVITDRPPQKVSTCPHVAASPLREKAIDRNRRLVSFPFETVNGQPYEKLFQLTEGEDDQLADMIQRHTRRVLAAKSMRAESTVAPFDAETAGPLADFENFRSTVIEEDFLFELLQRFERRQLDKIAAFDSPQKVFERERHFGKMQDLEVTRMNFLEEQEKIRYEAIRASNRFQERRKPKRKVL